MWLCAHVCFGVYMSLKVSMVRPSLGGLHGCDVCAWVCSYVVSGMIMYMIVGVSVGVQDCAWECMHGEHSSTQTPVRGMHASTCTGAFPVGPWLTF